VPCVACSKTDLQKSANPEGNALTFERGGFKQGSIYITVTPRVKAGLFEKL